MQPKYTEKLAKIFLHISIILLYHLITAVLPHKNVISPLKDSILNPLSRPNISYY